MKIRTIGLLLVVLILICAAIGTVYAFMIKYWNNSGTDTPTFFAAEVECEVFQKDNIITVTNTGNVSAYIRVELVVNWYNGEDLYYEPTTELNVGDTPDWKRKGNTFYYFEPVQENGKVILSLGNFQLDENKTVTETDKDGNVIATVVYYPKLEIIAEAVQADPTDAVSDLWNVILSGKQISGIKDN